MNEEEKRIIQEILATQDKQLIIDAIRIVEQENVPNKEKAVALLKKYFTATKKENYPLKEEEQQEQKRQYAQSFGYALQQERKQQEERRQAQILEQQRQKMQMKKVRQAYGIEEESEEKNISLLEKLRYILAKFEKSENREKQVLQTQEERHKELIKQLGLQNQEEQKTQQNSKIKELEAKQKERDER